MANPGVVGLWKRVLGLANVLLSVNVLRRCREDGRSQATIIKDRIKRWRAGDIVTLLDEAKKESNGRPRGRKKKRNRDLNQDEMNISRAKKFVVEGQYSRASEAL